MLRLHRLEVARHSASATHVCHAAWHACSLDLPLSGNRRFGWQYTLGQAHLQPLAVACSCIGGAYAASRGPDCRIDCLLWLIRQVNKPTRALLKRLGSSRARMCGADTTKGVNAGANISRAIACRCGTCAARSSSWTCRATRTRCTQWTGVRTAPWWPPAARTAW